MDFKDILSALLTTTDNATGITKGGIGAAFSLLSSGTKAFLGIGTAVSIASTAYTIYKKKQEELINNTQKASSAFNESNNSIQDQISKYKELKSQLDSGTLSSSEEYETKKQILDIQNQLVSSYGEQAEGIDLINGSLEKELSLMNELSVANANSYLNENAEGISKAKNEMEKIRDYSFGGVEISKDNESLISDLENIAKGIDGVDSYYDSFGNIIVKVKGNAVDAKDSIEEYMNKIRELKTEMEADGKDTSVIDTLIKRGSSELARNQKILDDFQSTYNTALQSDMISKGFGSDKPATIYKSYAEAVQEYNDALLSGDDSKIASAKTKFDEVQSSVDGVVEKYPEYTSLFDEVGSALDTASVKANDFKNALKMDDMSDVLNTLKNVKDIDLKSMNFDDNVTSDSENALAKIVDKAIELGIVSDDSSESIAEVVDILVQLGYVSGDSSNGIDKVTQSMSDLTEKTQGVVNDINAVMNALSGQKTGESISLADFNSDELKDYKSALEYVNGSMQLNAEKVQEITKAKADETIAINETNKALKQAEYLKNAGEIERLREKLKGLTEGTQDYNDVELQLQSLMSSNEAISAECAQYDLLTATIKEATSAYNNWLTAQNGSDYGDMFNDSLDAYARIMDTYNSKSDIYGDFGSKKFDAAVDFIVPDTVDSENTDAIRKYMDSFKQYLTFDDDGNATGMNIEQFCKNAVDKGLMVLDEAGENYQIAGQTTMEDFAEGLNMSSGMVQAFFDQLQLKGGEFDWADEAIKTVGDLGVKAYESAEALRSLDGNSDLEIKMDVSGIDNLDDKLSTLDDTIQQMNDLKAKPDVDPSQIEYANDIIQYCVAQKQKLSEPVFMAIDTSQVDGELGEVIGLIQQLQIAKNELDIQASVGADTTEAQGKVDSLVSQIQSKDATIKATIGDIDTSNVDTILAGVSAKSAEMWVSLGVNEDAVTGYVPENKTATVTYTLDSYAVDSYNPKNLRRTVTYTVVTNGNPPIVNGTAHVEGTAHMSGTVRSNPRIGKALASGEWGVNKTETALVGELGQELVVYGSKWFTVGDNGAEFTAIPKGAIVFNHKQTEEIFKNGYVTSGGGRGHAYASGTAYVKGGISVSNAKTGSYNSTTPKKSGKTTSTNQTAEKATEDVIDFVKILRDCTQEYTEILSDAIDDAIGLADKMSKNSSALSQIQKEISVNQQAYDKYMAQAGAVGLSESYASQIRNGSLNIENITNEDLKKKIEDYQKWFEEAKNCQETIRQLQKDEQKLALSRLEYIEDFYDAIVKLNDAYKDVNDTRIDLNDMIGNSAIGEEIQSYLKSSYDKQYDSYNQALSQLSDYQNEFNELVKNGYIEEGSNAWYEGQTKIQEFTKQVDESAIALIELEDKIREIDYTKLQQFIDGFDRRTDQLKNEQSLAEARDEQIGRDEYQKQIDELSKSINTNYELRDKKLQEQNLYDVTSTRYQELAKEIADLDNEIYSDLVDIEDLKDQIFETEFFNYEKEQENLEYFIGELDDFAKLLNEDAFFDKSGGFTDEAYAKIALTADAMAKCKQETANATAALKKLDEMYQNGLISETEYEDKQKELLDTIRDSVIATDDYKQELLDLYTEQMQKENDALKKSISLRQQALKSQKSYWDYADSIKSKTKDVDALKSQIAALEGVTSASAIATKKRLEAELADAEKSLSDTKRDHQYNLMNEGYSAMSDNLDQSLEDIEYSISHSSEKQLQAIQSMLTQMVGSYQEAFGKINSIIKDTGFIGSGSFDNTTTNIGTSTGSSSIANDALQDQSTMKPSDKVSNINTGNVSNGDHGNIEDKLKEEPNIDNRLCAELKISASSVSIQEGSSTSLSVSIRPNDAKNKTLSWISSDSSIASVSPEGKITGVKPGTATITVSTTDGSGLTQTCKVTVTKKPEPPKPKPPTQNTTTQGNGVPDVGDKVTFVSGIYHEDSYGGGRWGDWNLGQSVYITKINPNAPYPIHISTGNRLGSGDRGWLKLNQLRGYNRGSRYINRRQWAFMDDTSNGDIDAGSEVVITNRGILKQFEAGDHVFNNEQVQRLWDLSKDFDMSKFVNLNTSSMLGQLPDIVNRNDNSRNTEVNLNFDSLMTIEGNVYKEAIPGLQKEIDRMIPHISDKLGIFLRGELKKL